MKNLSSMVSSLSMNLKHYLSVDMYVFPVQQKGVPKVLWKHAAGVPVICTEETGTHEVGSGRRIVPRGDSQALADAILSRRDKVMRELWAELAANMCARI